MPIDGIWATAVSRYRFGSGARGFDPLQNKTTRDSLHSRGQMGRRSSPGPPINSCLFTGTLTTINIYFKIQNLATEELGKWYYFLSKSILPRKVKGLTCLAVAKREILPVIPLRVKDKAESRGHS